MSGNGTLDYFKRASSGSVDFATINDENKFFVNYETEVPTVSTLPGAPEVSLREFHQRSIVTPEHYLFFWPNRVYGTYTGMVSEVRGGRAAFRKHTEESKNREWSTLPDPRVFVKFGLPIWEVLENHAKGLNFGGYYGPGSPYGRMLTLSYDSEKGEYQFSYSSVYGNGQRVYTDYAFSESSGYNVVSQVTRHEEKITRSIEFEYSKEGGVFVPSLIRNTRMFKDREGIKSQRELKMMKTEINGDIDPETFTRQNLGLAAGERLIDEIEGIEYVVKEDGELRKAISSEVQDIADEVSADLTAAPLKSGSKEETSVAEDQAAVHTTVLENSTEGN
ncbi:hypothetical protein ACFL1X_11900 [Candidatus Hydrogenedentota bacterium]